MTYYPADLDLLPVILRLQPLPLALRGLVAAALRFHILGRLFSCRYYYIKPPNEVLAPSLSQFFRHRLTTSSFTTLSTENKASPRTDRYFFCADLYQFLLAFDSVVA